VYVAILRVYAAISHVYVGISRVYAAILHVYVAISRAYVAILHVYADILRVYANLDYLPSSARVKYFHFDLSRANTNGPVMCWDRGRPASKRAVRRAVFWLAIFSRFALIAGGTSAVPENRLGSSRFVEFIVRNLSAAR
jgi:hypothetical protein